MFLDREVFEDGLEHEVAAGEVLDPRGPLDRAPAAGQLLADRLDRAVDGLLLQIAGDERDAEPLQEERCKLRRHQPGADDPDLLDPPWRHVRNAHALLGPPLERLIGSMKFLTGYLLSGIGSGIGVVFLSKNGTQLVGASGAIMGVVGISAGLLLRHHRTTLAGRQLQNILVIVAIQTAFDLWTPQISLAAHLCGFLTGVGVGLILASLERPQTTF